MKKIMLMIMLVAKGKSITGKDPDDWNWEDFFLMMMDEKWLEMFNELTGLMD